MLNIKCWMQVNEQYNLLIIIVVISEPVTLRKTADHCVDHVADVAPSVIVVLNFEGVCNYFLFHNTQIFDR